MIGKCEKCGVDLPYWAERTGVTEFVGGLAAKLCCPCISEVRHAVETSDLWKNLMLVEASRMVQLELSGVGQDTTDALQNIMVARLAITSKLYDFVRALIPVSAPAATTE